MLHVADTGEVRVSLGAEGLMGERMGTSLREGRVITGRAEALLGVEDSKVSLGAGASLGKTGATEEIAGVALGDGVVEISLEVSDAGAFLGDGTVVASLGANVAGAFLEETGAARVTESSLEAVVAGVFCREGATSGSEVVTTSRDGFVGNSLGAEVLGAFLDGVFGFFEGEGGITVGEALGGRADRASVRATGIGAFLWEQGETATSCVSAGMALEATVAEAFCGVGEFS